MSEAETEAMSAEELGKALRHVDAWCAFDTGDRLRAHISRIEKERDEAREALTEAVAYADGVSWAEGMPADKQAKRLTFYVRTDDGAEYRGEWNVTKARAALASARGEVSPQAESEQVSSRSET